MQTLYLFWQDMEILWCAKDPVDVDKRWVVYKTNGLFRYKALWTKNLTETFVAEDNVLEKCMWKCVSRSIEHLINSSYYDDLKLCEKSKAFLSLLNNKYAIPTGVCLDNSLQL